jgi:YidC/Oxa1 family membrane protein insertase
MANLFHEIISTPFYNAFIFLIKTLPFLDAGVIVIIFTIIIKTILLPLSIKASKAQMQMKHTEKDMAEIREKYPSKEEQTKKIVEYYKEKGINPFASIFILIIQLPILIGLYQVFLRSGLPLINTSILYSFVSAPTSVNMFFLGLINITGKSIILALLAGITTYFQISMVSNSKNVDTKAPQGDMAKAMATQMKYFFPIVITFSSYVISAAIALYFITSNIFAIAQEIYIKKKYHKNVVVV